MKSKATLFFNAFLVIVFVFVIHPAGKCRQTYKLGMSLAITGPTSDAGNPYAKERKTGSKFVNETDYLGDGDKSTAPTGMTSTRMIPPSGFLKNS